MMKLLRKIHYWYLVFLIVASFVVLLPIYFLLTRSTKLYLAVNKLRKAHSFFCVTLAGIYFKFTFEEKLDKKQTYIYCANHFSNIDTLVMCVLARGNYHFMGKQELVNNPVTGLFFTTIDIPVFRESKISAFRAFKKASANLQKGMSLIIFPEGKIWSVYPPKLHEFKNGPFRLAIEQKIPIVAVSISDLWKLMWDDGKTKGTKPGLCNIYVHQVIETKHLSIQDADSLKELVFDKINSKLICK